MKSLTYNSHNLENFWELIQEELKKEYGEAIFKNWFSKLNLVSVSNREITLSVPTNFIRQWIITYYINSIRKLWQKYDNLIITVEIIVVADKPETKNSETTNKENFYNQFTNLPEKVSNDDILSSKLDSRYSFSNFIVGKSNEFAYNAAFNIADSTVVDSKSNPLFLYSNVGLGKTHLMNAIAGHISDTGQDRKVIYMSAEKFMYQFIRALRTKDIMAFKEQFRNVDVLMIDDIQFICGKESTQEEFFHTINSLLDNNRQIIISCDKSPNDLDGLEERIKSRLGGGLVADIHVTDLKLRKKILKSKIDQSDATVPSEVIEFLATKVTSNIRELEGALNKVIAQTNLSNKKITLENTKNILQDLIRPKRVNATIIEIRKKVADYYNITVEDMLSKARVRSIVRPRQIAIYLSKYLTSKSLIEIGKNFGGKDHTTVMHAVKNITQLEKKCDILSKDIINIINILQNQN